VPGVGIAAYGLYVPRGTVEAKTIARRFHLPEEVVRVKQGFSRKHISRPREMPSEMGQRAARQALERAHDQGVDRKDIGLVIYCGSQWKDYHIWLMSTYLQDRLGIPDCFAFDLSAMCAGVVFGLSAAKSFLVADPELRAVLLVGASKESYIVSPRDPTSRWMDNFADAGVGVVVARDFPRNHVLGSDFLSDGSLSLAPVERGGGARHPAYPAYVRARQVFAENLVPEAFFRKRMDEVSLPNFARVIRRSIARSGLTERDVRMVFLNHMKRSFHHAILAEVGIPEERAYYLEQYGHSQSADQILALDLALHEGRFTEGPTVMAAAGSGYVWGSTVVRWG
jgi:3-oxoacyl-[acyl-carrier-protein] synthase III